MHHLRRNAIPAGPWAIFTKFCVVDGFLIALYKNVGLSSSKSRKFWTFGKNLPLRNKSPWAIFFYKFRRGGECPRSILSRQTSWLWLYKCGLTGAKIVKIGNFWYKFAPTEYFFYKIWHGRGSSRSTSSYQSSPSSRIKCGLLQLPQSQKNGINLPN